MNSAIISYVCVFFSQIVRLYKKSATYKILMSIYDFIGNSWAYSVIMAKIKGGIYPDKSYKNSLFYKVIYLPFALTDIIRNRYCDKIRMILKRSVITGICLGVMNNLIALNSRFWGVMVFAAAATATAMRVAVGASLNIPILVIAVIAVIAILFDCNVTNFFGGSKFVSFIKSLIAFEGMRFNFYNESYCSKPEYLPFAALLGAFSGILLTYNPIFAIAVPFAVAGVITVLVYPIVGVFTAVMIAAFAPTMALAGVCCLTFLGLLLQSLINKDFTWRIDRVGFVFICMLVFMLVSCLFSYARVNSLTVWCMYLVFVGFYIVITNVIKTKKELFALFKAFVIVGAFIALYGVMQYLFGWTTSNAWIDEEMFEDAVMRVYSTMGNPNVLGEYLLLVLPISAVFMLKFRANTFKKWVYTGIFLVALLCMILTQSRGCWLGIMLATAVFITFYNGTLWGLAPIALIVVLYMMPQTMIDRLMSIGNLDDSSTSYRVFIWLGTLDMMKDFWLGGIGMGEAAFSKVYPLYSYNAIVAPHSHNTYLQMLVEGGIGMLIIFLIAMGIVLLRLSKIFRRRANTDINSMLVLAVASGVCGFLLQSMFDYTFYNYRMMAMFFMIIAMGISVGHTYGGINDTDN